MHHSLIDPAKLHFFEESRRHKKTHKSVIQGCANLRGTSMSFLPVTCDDGLQCPKETRKKEKLDTVGFQQLIAAWRHNKNQKPKKIETPNTTPDDASNVCESSKNCTFLEFLMRILTHFCGGTAFHHLWDYKILSKRDDRILHVLEVWFGNRSRIKNCHVYTQTVHFQYVNIEHR